MSKATMAERARRLFRPVAHLREVPARAWLTVVLPVVVGAIAAFAIATHYVRPAPPDEIVFAAGPAGSAYRDFADAYAKELARERIRVKILETPGARRNYRFLQEGKETVDVGLVRSGIGDNNEAPHLVSLGVTGYEALWVFCRGKGILDDLPGLRGKTIAIGGRGAGTRRLVRTLLAANGIDEDDFTAVEIGGTEAAEALFEGKVDCAFLFEPPEAGVLKALMYSPLTHVVDFTRRADAYVSRIPALHKVVLPEGGIDLAANRPDRPVTLLAAQTQLVARDDLHPAVQMLLLQAATRIHGEAGMFQREQEFPARRAFEFALSDSADRFYTSGRPLLQRYLPFWLANLVDRMLVFLLPAFAILFPLVRILPPLYAWTVRRRIYRWYGELMYIENEMRRTLTHGETRDFGARLDWIEREVNDLQPPLAFANQVYALRQHIDFVQEKLERIDSPGDAGMPPASPSDDT